MDLTISGVGTSTGGEFDTVDINGAGTVNGDLRCKSISINGTGTIHGDVEFSNVFSANGAGTVKGCVSGGRLEVNGSGHISRDARFESMTVNGVCKVVGELDCGYAEINGTCTAERGLRAEECRNNGVLTVDGDLCAERYVARGAFRISGLLSADDIDIKFVRGAKVREIGGGRVRIRKYDNTGTRILDMLADWIPGTTKRLTCELIEADEVSVEDSEVGVIRGDVVVVGPNCAVGRVEYRTSLDIHPSSKVGDAVKTT